MRKFNSKKIMYVVNHASFFVSHRLPLADEAIKRGATVGLCVGIGVRKSKKGVPMKFSARGQLRFLSVNLKVRVSTYLLKYAASSAFYCRFVSLHRRRSLCFTEGDNLRRFVSASTASIKNSSRCFRHGLFIHGEQ